MHRGRQQHAAIVLARQESGEVEPIFIEVELAEHLLAERIAVRQGFPIGHPILADDYHVGAGSALLHVGKGRHRLRKAAIGLHAPRHVGDELVDVGQVEAGQLQPPAGLRRKIRRIHAVMLHRELATQQGRKLRRLIRGRHDAPVARLDVEQNGGVARPDPVHVVPRRLVEESDVRSARSVVPLEVADVLRGRPDIADVQAGPPPGVRHDHVGRVAGRLHLPCGAREPLSVEDCLLDEREVGMLFPADLAVRLEPHHAQPLRRRSLPVGTEGHVMPALRQILGERTELSRIVVVQEEYAHSVRFPTSPGAQPRLRSAGPATNPRVARQRVPPVR